MKANLQQAASQSYAYRLCYCVYSADHACRWELGTEAEALTELDFPTLSVYSPLSLPPPTHLNSTYNASEVLSIATTVVQNKPANIQPFIQDGAVGDPPSAQSLPSFFLILNLTRVAIGIGVAVLLANYTGTSGADFAGAAQSQLDYLLYTAPRSDQGAISHRSDQVQLWSDFIYMTPPFIAYYGAVTLNQTLLTIAYQQISLYRDQLRDSSGLWRHIALGTGTDDGHWATGNGWAAAGMLRVAETIKNSAFSQQMEGNINDLVGWSEEIVNAVWSYQVRSVPVSIWTLANTGIADERVASELRRSRQLVRRLLLNLPPRLRLLSPCPNLLSLLPNHPRRRESPPTHRFFRHLLRRLAPARREPVRLPHRGLALPRRPGVRPAHAERMARLDAYRLAGHEWTGAELEYGRGLTAAGGCSVTYRRGGGARSALDLKLTNSFISCLPLLPYTITRASISLCT